MITEPIESAVGAKNPVLEISINAMLTADNEGRIVHIHPVQQPASGGQTNGYQ
jgi:hypothetical protein